MITLTPAAAKQIRLSAKEGNLDGLPIRVAATKNNDGSLHYGMGFDDVKEDDTTYTSENIDVVISEASKSLLNGTTIDYVEIEPGNPQFIFMNPNDPNFKPPTE
ncbi:MAG: iron-sulfur cluster assembly accessory protein [Gammaproteobacteria bacterium]|nr:iron-sulfur cluster assembly accessory protein [Gammaproteobacteria bacterium]MDH5734968.1 iron-sulfur cluster assembly accessory protein [Gammaproteobacteria bacterium]